MESGRQCSSCNCSGLIHILNLLERRELDQIVITPSDLFDEHILERIYCQSCTRKNNTPRWALGFEKMLMPPIDGDRTRYSNQIRDIIIKINREAIAYAKSKKIYDAAFAPGAAISTDSIEAITARLASIENRLGVIEGKMYSIRDVLLDDE